MISHFLDEFEIVVTAYIIGGSLVVYQSAYFVLKIFTVSKILKIYKIFKRSEILKNDNFRNSQNFLKLTYFKIFPHFRNSLNDNEIFFNSLNYENSQNLPYL